MNKSLEVRALLAFSIAASACTTPTPNRVDATATLPQTTPTQRPLETTTTPTPPPTPLPETMNYIIRTCQDLNWNELCDPGDKPLGNITIGIANVTISNGNETDEGIIGRTDANGEAKVSGPFPIGGGFKVGAELQVTIGTVTYCRESDFRIQSLGSPDGGQTWQEEVSVLYDKCSSPPPQFNPSAG